MFSLLVLISLAGPWRVTLPAEVRLKNGGQRPCMQTHCPGPRLLPAFHRLFLRKANTPGITRELPGNSRKLGEKVRGRGRPTPSLSSPQEPWQARIWVAPPCRNLTSPFYAPSLASPTQRASLPYAPQPASPPRTGARLARSQQVYTL